MNAASGERTPEAAALDWFVGSFLLKDHLADGIFVTGSYDWSERASRLKEILDEKTD
jgi:hypothetical protein